MGPKSQSPDHFPYILKRVIEGEKWTIFFEKNQESGERSRASQAEAYFQ